MEVYKRFISYVKVHTASSDSSGSTPSTERQLVLSRLLEAEMNALGMEGVHIDENAYTYGFIPASEGCEDKPCIGFIAHLDTSPDFSGKNVRPRIIRDYDGGDVVLGSSGRILSVTDFPHLPSLKGQSLIVTDGSTLLGADDKAGIAAIVSACEQILSEKIPHGRIAVCFTPDEEVGHGAALLDIEKLGADFAYTVDGGSLNEICYETFNAAAALWELKGFSIHPGEAKGHMINAALVATEINSLLPAGDIPAKTEGYEGFYHLTELSGSVERASLAYIIRDHDSALFEGRKQAMRHIEKLINEKYGPGTARLTIHEQYRNMAEMLRERMDIVELAERALRRSGLEPVTAPIRGGTDGAQLSYRGLLCPNLGTGGYACHGPFEHITAEGLAKAAEIVVNIIKENLN